MAVSENLVSPEASEAHREQSRTAFHSWAVQGRTRNRRQGLSPPQGLWPVPAARTPDAATSYRLAPLPAASGISPAAQTHGRAPAGKGAGLGAHSTCAWLPEALGVTRLPVLGHVPRGPGFGVHREA